jgi:adenylate cyclase
MILQARRLKQPDSMPVGCYRTKKTPLVASRITTLIREAVKKEQHSISTADRNKYSAHSL